MLRSALRVSFFAVVVTLASACSQATSDDAETSGAAFTQNEAYDAVVAKGQPRSETDGPTENYTSRTHTIAYFRGGDAAALTDRFLDLAHWVQIKNLQNEALFSKVKLQGDTREGAKRTVTAELKGMLSFEARAVASSEEGGAFAVRFANTTAFTKLRLTVIEPDNVVIEGKILPYAEGAIVDATMTVTMKRGKEHAPDISGAINAICRWLAAP